MPLVSTYANLSISTLTMSRERPFLSLLHLPVNPVVPAVQQLLSRYTVVLAKVSSVLLRAWHRE